MRLPATKIFYFTFFAGLCAVWPYCPIYFRQAGAHGWQLGLLVALPALIGIASGPLFGALADATRSPRGILIMAQFGAAAALGWVYHTSGFLWLFPGMILYAFFSAPIIPLIDSTTLGILGERRAEYGRHRIWGTWGWMVFSALIAPLIGRYGVRVGLYVYFAMQCVAVTSAWSLRAAAPMKRPNLKEGLRMVAGNETWLIFLSIGLLGGFALSITSAYVIFVMDGFGLSAGYKGWAIVIQTMSEVPAMIWGARLIHRFGARRLLVTALTAYALRGLVLSFAHDGPHFLAAQSLHGLSYGLLWMGGVGYAHRIAPPGMVATAQSLFSSFSMGLGMGLGSLAGGFMFEKFGAAMTYRFTAALTMAGVVLVVTSIRAPRSRAAARVA